MCGECLPSWANIRESHGRKKWTGAEIAMNTIVSVIFSGGVGEKFYRLKIGWYNGWQE